MKLLLTIVSILILANPSWGKVNMRNGSYTEKWVDFIDPGAGIEIKIERFYSSRSLFDGMFGFGWCSHLETKLKITSDGILNLVECGGGLEVTYMPSNFDKMSKENTIKNIIKFEKAERKLSAADISNLKTQLRSSTKMRFQYANKHGLVDINKIKKNKNTFLSKAKGYEKIVFDGRGYKRQQYNGVIQTFDKSGKLVQITEPTGQNIKIDYRGSHIKSLKDDTTGRSLTFAVNNGKVTKISNGRGLSVSYKYSGEDLVEATNMWSKTYKFTYDNNHNMTRVDFPDSTNITMSYVVENDWIKRYKNRKGCTEEFRFFTNKKTNNPNNYWGTWTRSGCAHEPTFLGRHEFWYKNYTLSKGKYLHRVQEEFTVSRAQTILAPEAQKVVDNFEPLLKSVYFDPYLGRPITIRENQVYRGFSYLSNGLTHRREDKLYTKRNDNILSWSKYKFGYAKKSPLIRKIEHQILTKKGKIKESQSTSFKYNKNGFLTKASEGKKKFVSIAYNSFGKIESLSDEKKNKLRLTYKPGVEKPVGIKQTGIGEVTITYDINGDVATLDSGAKRGIATSIIEKFLGMISFLGPMGENLEI